jgi:N-formylglutamate amidohydrolase
MGIRSPYVLEAGLDRPLVAAAIHAGHDLRPEVARLMALDEDVRLREEDPYTDAWTSLASNRVCVRRSRFEVDLNRPTEDAVCFVPEDCWELQVWRSDIPSDLYARSLAIHERFYADVAAMLGRLTERFGAFVVYDIHSYNHRRLPTPAEPSENPDINLGTGTLDRSRWGHVVDAFMDAIDRYDVRENVKFRGGYLSQWVHETFPDSGCALAIEVKKIFMDERSGELDERAHAEIGRALTATVDPVLRELGAVRR